MPPGYHQFRQRGACGGPITEAIDAYRTAVTINQRDYRAWYGLGQTYELLRTLI